MNPVNNKVAKPPTFKTVSLSHFLPQEWYTLD